MLTEKYIRPNNKELGHTKIYNNNEYIGYIIPIKSKSATTNDNWHFQNVNFPKFPHLKANNRKELLNKIHTLWIN